jgi:hypothetical protein
MLKLTVRERRVFPDHILGLGQGKASEGREDREARFIPVQTYIRILLVSITIFVFIFVDRFSTSQSAKKPKDDRKMDSRNCLLRYASHVPRMLSPQPALLEKAGP